MPLERGDSQFSHIRFERIPDFQPNRRTRSGYGRRPPAPESRSAHAQEVSTGFSAATQQVASTRTRLGIDPSQLFVLEFNTINLDLRDAIERYRAWIVEEYSIKQGDDEAHRFLVQFPDETSRQLFLSDLRLYRTDSEEMETLPPGMRRTFFDALQEPIRKPSREERMGVRLRRDGFPEPEPFYLDIDFWHPPSEDETHHLRAEIRSLCQRMQGAVVEEVRTSSLLLAKVRANRALAEALLELDLVARVDLPPKLAPAYPEIFRASPPAELPLPTDQDPMVFDYSPV